MEEDQVHDFVNRLDVDSDLLHQSWNAVTYMDGRWAAKMCYSTSGVSTMITNFERAFVDDRNTLQRFKALNPNVEGSTKQLFGWIFDMVLERSKSVVSVLQDDSQSLAIRFEATISDLPIVWEFRGQRCDEPTFYKQVTEPMLLLVSQQNRREESLFALLEQKDKIIERLGGSGGSEKFSRTEWTDKDIYSQDSINLCRQFARRNSAVPFDQLLVRYLSEKLALVHAYTKANLDPPSVVPKPDPKSVEPTKVKNGSSVEKDESSTTTATHSHHVSTQRNRVDEPPAKKKKPLRL